MGKFDIEVEEDEGRQMVGGLEIEVADNSPIGQNEEIDDDYGVRSLSPTAVRQKSAETSSQQHQRRTCSPPFPERDSSPVMLQENERDISNAAPHEICGTEDGSSAVIEQSRF